MGRHRSCSDFTSGLGVRRDSGARPVIGRWWTTPPAGYTPTTTTDPVPPPAVGQPPHGQPTCPTMHLAVPATTWATDPDSGASAVGRDGPCSPSLTTCSVGLPVADRPHQPAGTTKQPCRHQRRRHLAENPFKDQAYRRLQHFHHNPNRLVTSSDANPPAVRGGVDESRRRRTRQDGSRRNRTVWQAL
jgi:hypothetical protein